MEANENHALTKAESCYHCKPLVQQRNELAAQVERLRFALKDITQYDKPESSKTVTDFGRDFDKGQRIAGMKGLARNALLETPPAALEALKDYHFREFCDCNVTARKMQMAASKGLKITGFLTDDGKCCIDGKVQPLEALKAQWQAEAVRDFADECGISDFAEQYLCQRAQEAGDE